MITGMTIPHMIDTESTKTATQSRQETTTETTVNSSLNGIDMTGFETEIYYINSAEDFDRCTYAVQNRNGKKSFMRLLLLIMEMQGLQQMEVI